MEDKTFCENCNKEIGEDEAQQCSTCDMDGLGNCCIGADDHPCEDAEDDGR